jgi:hypothetical protein
MSLIEDHGRSGYSVAHDTGLTEQAIARIRKRMERTKLVEQLREVLARFGITDVPVAGSRAAVLNPENVITVPVISRGTRRELIADWDEERRTRKIEEAEVYGIDLDERDLGSIELRRVESGSLLLTKPDAFEAWLWDQTKLVPAGYDVGV